MKDAGACIVCKCPVWLPDALYETAQRSAKVTFYCGHGHSMCFAQGESEETKLRRERARLAQRIAERDDTIRMERGLRENAERSAAAQKGLVTRIKNRVGHGVCPCCNRTFSDLARHMKSKHDGYTKPDAIVATQAVQ